MSRIVEEIRRVAPDALLEEGASRRFAVTGLKPSAVVAPAYVEQVAEVLSLCSSNGWTVEAAGAGTWLGAGRRPTRVDIVMTTDRLRDMPEYEPADLTIAVGAGMPVDELQRETGRNRQFLPLDPPSRAGGTVGATFATASAGPLRLSQGTPRDHALGLEVVTSDGRTLRLGGRVVKNVAGYDLVRLIVGSRGTLGIITRLHLRLRPLPTHDRTVTFSAEHAGELAELCAEVHPRIRPSALELLSPAVSQTLTGNARWTLAVRLQGNEEAVRDAGDRLEALSGAGTAQLQAGASAGARASAGLLAGAEGAAFWDGLHRLEAEASVMIRVADLPSRLASTLAAAEAIAERAAANGSTTNGETAWRIAAHAGDGIVRLWRDDSPPRAEATVTAEAVVETRQRLMGNGGTVHVSCGAHLLSTSLDPWGAVGTSTTLRLMQGIQREFDPAGILAPGRFVR